MNFRYRAICAIWLIVIPAFMSARGAANQWIDENKALDKRAMEAFVRKDINTIMSFYWRSPSLVVVFPYGTVITGWDNVKAGLAEFLGMVDAIEFTDEHTEYRVIGESVVAFGTAKFRIRTTDGRVEEGDLITTNIRQKMGKEWVVTHEHMSMPVPMTGPQPTDSLYKRLGGYDAIAELTDDLFAHMKADAQLGALIRGVNESHFKKIRQLKIEMFCEAAGGPCTYTGANMDTAHAGLGIKDGDWRRFIELLDQSLERFQVPQRERGEVKAFLASLRPLIVTP
jgi:hemoglobin